MATDLKQSLPSPPGAVTRRPAAGVSVPAQGLARSAFGGLVGADQPSHSADPKQGDPVAQSPAAATETIGRRAGALSDELDFPEFVASLVHGTFDAIVDSSIRQMESYADLVAAVAKPIDQFTQENVSANQARDWLLGQFPSDLSMQRERESFRLLSRPNAEGEARTPAWLADFGLDGEELTDELVEETLVPLARERVARDRLQTLATMVLLGMNRVVVREGSISARLRFRAAAADHARVDYAVSDDPVGGVNEWGRRGSRTFAQPTTKVSTVGVNVQTDSQLKAELFGQVKLDFASETVPLDRFVDEARRTLLERHARPAQPAAAPAPAAPQPQAALPPAQGAPPGAAAPALPPAPATPAAGAVPVAPQPAGGGER